MAPLYRTHLTVLADTASRHPDAPVFKLPLLDPQTQQVRQWDVITYEQFHSDVERFARYWTQELTAVGVPQRSVVGVW